MLVNLREIEIPSFILAIRCLLRHLSRKLSIFQDWFTNSFIITQRNDCEPRKDAIEVQIDGFVEQCLPVMLTLCRVLVREVKLMGRV